MKEIVEKILKEEQAASKTIEKAKKDAEGIILQAKKDAEGIIKKSILDAQDLAQNKKIEARKNFLSEKERILAETRSELIFQKARKEKDIPDISEKVFSRIINIDI